MSRGFTLIELLISLALVSLLLLMYLPVSLASYQKNQLQMMENELSTAVRYVRNKALMTNRRLILTPLPNSRDWSKGMILFVDNKQHLYTKSDKLLHRWQWKSQGMRINWRGFLSNHYLLFASDLKEAACSGHFDLVTQEGQHSILVVNRLGRIKQVASKMPLLVLSKTK